MDTVPITVLCVDDEPLNLELIGRALSKLPCRVQTAEDGGQALNAIQYNFPGIVVTDVRMPRMDGLELFRRVREIDPDVPVMLVTAYADLDSAVQAMRDSAYDLIERPFDTGRFLDAVRRAMRQRTLTLENRALRAEVAARAGSRILGKSTAMASLRKTIAMVADTDATVLIRGETGTGKELVARSLHEQSGRSAGHFVALNCAAMPEALFEDELFGHESGAFTGASEQRVGKLEHAMGGTLFLDEIESIPLSLQVKLLRVLQERVIRRLGSNQDIDVDFRLVAATQVDLLEAIEAKIFRADLYYRLNVAELHIPPLNARREDILPLLESFVHELALHHGREAPVVSPEDLQTLMEHPWPGNVRELRNVAERHVLGLSPQSARAAGLMAEADDTQPSLRDQVDAFEKAVLERQLARQQGRIQATADALSTPVRTLQDRMRKHGFKRKSYAP